MEKAALTGRRPFLASIHRRDAEDTEDAQRETRKSLCPLSVLCAFVVNYSLTYIHAKFTLDHQHPDICLKNYAILMEEN